MGAGWVNRKGFEEDKYKINFDRKPEVGNEMKKHAKSAQCNCENTYPKEQVTVAATLSPANNLAI